MKHFLGVSIGLIICFITFLLIGCSEINEMNIVEGMDAPVIAITPESVFERLQVEFAGRLENQGDFSALREITTSQTYQDYLAKVCRTAVPVASLEEYAAVAPPDADRYTPFLKEWIDKPTVEDIAVMHRLTRTHRESDYLLFQARLQTRPLRWTDEIFLSAFEEDMGALGDPATRTFLMRYNINDRIGFYYLFSSKFVVRTEIADAIWLHEQMETHGRDLGLLWSAIQRPALVGEILHNFSETEIFLEWVAMTRVREMEGE